jgi:exopolyphosphatase/pppGpp-phosphohydrolase
LVESAEFGRDRLSEVLETLWSVPLAARRTRPGLPPERADVILFGVAIYDAVLRVFGFGSLGVSTRGLRYAAMLGEGCDV